jgi:AcrR family transcriptional regulator
MTTNKTPTEATRERILQAAAKLFAEKGYARATTRAIAEAAKVNEVTIFRHFGSKNNLLSELIQTRSALPNLSDVIENQLSGDYRQDLTLFARIFLKALLQRKDALRLMLCEANELPEIRDVVAQIPKQLRQITTEYLQGQIDQGAVRGLDPELMAQAFLGMFFSYAVAAELLGGQAAFEQSTDEIISQFVDIFVKGTSQV